MVKIPPRIAWSCVITLFCASGLHAGNLSDYQVGDTAAEDITTPVALDVIDAEATAARKSAEALKTPAIFYRYPDADITNAVAGELQAAFAATRSNFVAALKADFPFFPLQNRNIATARFTQFVSAFNGRSKSFPVGDKLAASWAAGKAGLDTEDNFIAMFLQMAQRPIRPDDLPDGFTTGDTLLLVPVYSATDKATLAEAEQRGELITKNTMTSLSRLQTLFCREFPNDEQALARSLSVFFEPNCAPAVDLTREARDRDVSRLVVADHYDAGQVIVRRGATIDSKIKTALVALNAKLMPEQLNMQIAAAQSQAQRQHARNVWLVAALAVVSVVSLASVLLVWQQSRWRRQSVVLAPARIEPSAIIQTEFAPQLARAIKDALSQELAEQRHELLSAQQRAAAEIADLVRRLDRLQAPMQERLRIYETQIQKLEKELAARNEENHELLKMKIEMIHHQLASERARGRPDFAN